jgi:hypothetical protein
MTALATPYPYDPLRWGSWWEQQLEDTDEIDNEPDPAVAVAGPDPAFDARLAAILDADRAFMGLVFKGA